MLKPLHKNILKNKLKIDQYRTQTCKLLDDNEPLLVTKSIPLMKIQTLQLQEDKRRQSRKITFNLDNQQVHCHCTRQDRHKSHEKKKPVFRVKKSFTTLKLLTSTSMIEKEEKSIQKFSKQDPKVEEKIGQAIITYLKRIRILEENLQQNLEIKTQDLKKLNRYLICFNSSNLQHRQDTLMSYQDQFIKELDQYLKKQLKKEVQSHLNHCYSNHFESNKAAQRDNSYKQDKKNKEAVLSELKRKVEQKSQQLQLLQEKVQLNKAVIQKYESKTLQIDHYLNDKNKLYIEQLCQNYHKHLLDLSSYSILVQTEERKDKAMESFVQIEQNVQEQLKLITEAFYGKVKMEKELCFVKTIILRITEYFRTKYHQLQQNLQQKSIWIGQLISKIKGLVNLSSFKQEYLPKLVNQFNLTYIRLENTLKLFKNKVEGKENLKVRHFSQKLEQIRVLLKKLCQNYTLTSTFH